VHMRRILFSLLIFSTMALAARAQVTHYSVKLIPDFDNKILRGEETIALHREVEDAEWQKQASLQVLSANSSDGDVLVKDESVILRRRAAGTHTVYIQYKAAAGRGIEWFADKAGMDTAFYCEAWMVCDSSPAQRATLSLEIVLPVSNGMRAVGPGRMTKHWNDKDGEHFLFEQAEPVQTYLFSFGVARLNLFSEGKFVVYAADSVAATAEKKGARRAIFAKSADVYTFLRGKAGVDMPDQEYAQAFLPSDIEQEAAGIALMPAKYLPEIEGKDDVNLMAHEMAHQWWGALVGIRSWSDFWLNEGMADFMMDAYLEQRLGRAAYEAQIAAARKTMEQLRAKGKDRPLHWENWKDAHEALGDIPYVKGELFLDRLRTELGDEKFWRGIALYTTRNAGRLVDSGDFERAMEEASGRNLTALFNEGVYH
jgi:aminopeptidase N